MNFSKSDIPFQVVQLIDTLHVQGFEGWLVGGAIRMLLLGQKPKDWDVTTNAKPDQIQNIFPKTIATGIAYGTVTVVMNEMEIQVTTFRKEGAYENHRKPSEVSYCSDIQDDLSRRDFTINAIAFNPHTNVFEDPFEGQRDLDNQLIKAVGDPNLRFEEDALRILRAIRFQAQLGFFIDSPTLNAMAESSRHLDRLSEERVQQEFSKWLVGDFFSMTKETAQRIHLTSIFEENPSPDFEEKWDFIPTIEPSLLFRLLAFFDLYTGPNPQPGKTDKVLKLLKSLKYPQNLISKVVQFIEFLSLAQSNRHEPNHAFTKKALEIGLSNAVLLLQWKLEQLQDKQPLLKQKFELTRLIESGFEEKVSPLAIDGNRVMEILNLSPGPEVKKTLQTLQDWVFENPERNTRDHLENFLRKK